MTTTTAPTSDVVSLLGFTEKRGTAWIGRGVNESFAGAIPRERAIQTLSYPLAATDGIQGAILTEDGVTTYTDRSRKMIVRTDTGKTLGVFKQGYQIHEPQKWCLENLELILDGGLQIASVVVAKHGAIAMLQAELSDTFEGPEGVNHRPFLTAATSHDGSIATTYLTNTRILICDNMISGALSTATNPRTKIRHSSKSLTRVLDVRTDLGLVLEQVGDEFNAQVQALLDVTVTRSKWDAFVKAYAGTDGKEGRAKTIADNKADVLRQLYNQDERVAPWANSAYGVLAAVNTAENHIFGADKNREERNQLRVAKGEWSQIDHNTLRLLASV